MTDEEVRDEDRPEGAITDAELVQPDEVVGEVDEDEEVEVVDDDDSKSLSNVAQEVREGKWGQGQERRRKLEDAGFDPNEVEAEVTRLLNE